jgi:hypothetical protein
VCYFLDKIVT